MRFKEERFITLLKAYMNEQISESEFEELVNYIQQADTAQLNEQLLDLFDKAWQQANQQLPIKLDAERVLHGIMTSPQLNTQARRKKPKVWLIAASIAALVCLATLLVRQYTPLPLQAAKEKLLTQEEDTLTSDRREVMLTLSDGHQIPVNALSEGVQTFQSGTHVKRDQNQLIYTEDQDTKAHPSPALHTITTPIGMDYKLTLPDGTRVQLNAGSSLTFPVAFGRQERKVELQGEAYFDVAKHPNQAFLVQAKGTDIHVLGTAFNVSAYHEDPYVVTTLLTGSLKVQSKILRPGQQALSNETGHPIVIREVDPDEIMAWARGYFVFDQDDIKQVMNTLARWYDIEVVYEGNLKGKTFGGTLSRYTDFRQLLHAIEQTGSVKFTITGRRVTVSP
jgi:ferric-dicitrate binding protein FerR (iron transport regulator)